MKFSQLHYRRCCRTVGTKESGNTLIVSLVLMLIMSLIGAASMRTVSLEEKMAVASRDRGLAFQATEAALRAAENNISSLVAAGSIPADRIASDYTSVYSSSNCTEKPVTCSANSGVCARPLAGCTARWDSSATPSAPWISGPTLGSSPNQINTQYFVEVFTRDTPCVTKILEQDVDGVCTTFRITARSEPQTDRAGVMLQSMYVWPN